MLEPWTGLGSWRSSSADERRFWSPKGPVAPQQTPALPGPSAPSLAEYGRTILLTPDPKQKAELTHAAWRAYLSGALPIGISRAPAAPARPAKPELVPARQIPTMKQTTLPLNVYMLHNLAHVELNAIDLAWDTVVRFSALRLPSQFYADFARVADDESRHLGWCLQRLEELGHEYGCMPAHNLLWEGCAASRGDVLDRMAVVPMSQEARGLDAGTRLAERLVGWGDNISAAIVARIAEEERAHVAVGVAWFHAVCAAQGLPPEGTFRETLLRLCPDLLKGTFNHQERQHVGLRREWYDSSCWSDELQEAAAVAVARAQGRAREESGTHEGLRGGVSGVGLDIEELRRRLEAMVAAEVHAAAP